METLLPVMSKLMRVFSEVNIPGIELPRSFFVFPCLIIFKFNSAVVVIGSQSSGKSSVIEAFVQRDFLPRGSGIVTRCPLVLHLVREKDDFTDDYGEFNHLPARKIHDFKEIRREIENFTSKEAGGGKAVSDKQIFLTIHSASVVDLIVVDLPGMTKVAVGDQPADIERQIREMSERFIKSPKTIILAVSPGL
jgi:dynamin 1-like protein